jgi:hypothetical protein
MTDQQRRAALEKRADGARFIYEADRQSKGSRQVVLIRTADDFIATFTPDRIIQLFREPVTTDEGYPLGKRLYDRCMEVYHQEVQALHQQYLTRKNITHPSRLAWKPVDLKGRHCHECKHLISSSWHFVCESCSWNVCTQCGSCGEGYVRRTVDFID